MLEGQIAGLAAAKALGAQIPDFDEKIAALERELQILRAGPLPERVRRGLEKVRVEWK